MLPHGAPVHCITSIRNFVIQALGGGWERLSLPEKPESRSEFALPNQPRLDRRDPRLSLPQRLGACMYRVGT
jgi:hypothetical protein